jgi:hypothetical protein
MYRFLLSGVEFGHVHWLLLKLGRRL